MTAAPLAVVTGGGSGIGLATCARLAEDGFTVAALDLQPAAAAGIAALTAVCDVTDEADISAAMASIAERFGGIDVGLPGRPTPGPGRSIRCRGRRFPSAAMTIAPGGCGLPRGCVCYRLAAGPGAWAWRGMPHGSGGGYVGLLAGPARRFNW